MARDPWLPRRLRPRGTPRRTVRPRGGQGTGGGPDISGRHRPRGPVPHDDADTEERPSASRGHLIVCGDDPLAFRLADELVRRYHLKVTVILPSRRLNQGPQLARLPAVRLVEADRLDVDAFRHANIAGAEAVALMRQDDVGNIHAALQAQELNPHAHLVIRMFNLSLGQGIRTLFRGCSVISDAAMAAPAFVAAALGEVAPVHVRLPGRTLYVTRREAVPANRVACALTARDGQRTVLLPRDPAVADLVLAVAEAGPGGYIEDLATPRARTARWRRRLHRLRTIPFRAVRVLYDRKLTLVAIVLGALVIAGSGVLASVRGLSWWNAAYVTLLTALGGANPDIGAPAIEKIIQTVLTIASIALIPVVTGAVVEAVVHARLALALGRLREPMAGHVVVVGLGNVGTRVIRQLHLRGIPVVAIDKAGAARGAQLARELRVPLIIGDASREETLRAAYVQTCRALVVLSTDDVVNLEAALHGRELNPGVRVVLRLFDGDFAVRVQRAFRIDVSRSVSYLAAPAFAAAMMRREVIGVIPVGRRVLLIAEVPVCVGSTVDGSTVGAVQALDGVRAIAVTTDGHTRWAPPPQHHLVAGDQLVVVASREGLGRIMAATTHP